MSGLRFMGYVDVERLWGVDVPSRSFNTGSPNGMTKKKLPGISIHLKTRAAP